MFTRRMVFKRALAAGAGLAGATAAMAAGGAGGGDFPRPLATYENTQGGLLAELAARIQAEPFNLAATLIFLLAIVHTFLTAKFRHMAHEAEAAHAKKLERRAADRNDDGHPDEVSFKGQILHFLGEVEAVFGLWVVALGAAIVAFKGWGVFVDYVGHRVNFTEAMFVVVIMAIAATRPVTRFAEQCLRAVAGLGGGTAGAWWLSILIIGPVLGSFITEPAAMTISALLLGARFYELRPPARFCYATLGLLFVNVSVGGTLTHFAAPPVLMVAGPWKWDMAHMFTHFGWKSVVGIVVATAGVYAVFRGELRELEERRRAGAAAKAAGTDEYPVPVWLTAVQLLFLAAVVYFAHYPALFIGVFLFFIAFAQATAHHQSRLDLKAPLLVGFFLAGLVIHGGLQGWWIEPVLKSMGPLALFGGATLLTAFNDNAAITYLATLVPGFTNELKYMVVAGAVTGGGLTVIANAPNPAGQSILQRYFPGGVSPLGLATAALPPTAVIAACFILL